MLEKVCAAFETAGVHYALVGGHAVALYGAVRGTVDVDFVLRWNRKTVQTVERTMLELGFVSRLPVTADDIFNFRDEYIRNRNLIAWNFYNPDDLTEQVDILINYDLTGHKIKKLKVQGAMVKVLNLKDLIEMKKASGRRQDLEDAAVLERLSNES